jgi:hypothetical protein
VNIHEIERLLDERSLLPGEEVGALLEELEEAALADLRAEGSALRDRARLRLKALNEYRALRAFAVRNGWRGPDHGWPLRAEAREAARPGSPPAPALVPAPLGEVADAATLVIKPVWD